MPSPRLLFLTLILHQLSIINCNATITINSVNVTVSTCPNNGTAAIFARSTSDSAVFLYNIIAGPVLYPLQNDSTFSSLYPGTYTARVHDVNSYDSAQTTFTITGTYQQLVFTPTPVAPLCGGGNNSEIIANPNGTGLAPYSFQIISPFTGTPQASDTLDSLAAGTYIVKVTDVCDNAVTQGVVVDSGGSGFEFSTPFLQFIGCDTALYFQVFYLNDTFEYLPLKLTMVTSTDTVFKYEIPIPEGLGAYQIIDTLYNLDFGDYLKICITDPCNITYCYPLDTVNPFVFNLGYYNVDNNCVLGSGADIQFNANPRYILAYPTSIPLTFTLTDTVSHIVVDSFFFKDTCSSDCRSIPPQTGGHSYLFTVRDNCGDISQQMVQWPTPLPVSFGAAINQTGCIDSTSIVLFGWSGLGSDLTIQLLSGPPTTRSTKSGFAYSDTIIYPVIFTKISNISGSCYIGYLPAGIYTYQASDSCGHIFTGSFNVNVVSSLAADYTIARNCGGLNTLSTFLGDGLTNYGAFLYTFMPDYILPTITTDSTAIFTSLSTGTYPLRIYFYNNTTVFTIPGLPSCWSITDTITIPPINDSILAATDVATCNGTIYIQLEADTNNGVLPFKYEIISGPETFAPQYSNLFTVTTYGTYVVGVVDSCGNVDARQISVDTGRFSPVVHSGGWCPGSKAQLIEVASPFFSYVWKKPDGTLFTGDTLVINPFTNADTGTYLITKTVNINGCTDSALGSYHLVFRDTFQQSVSFCPGDTLYVGPYIHTAGGLYADTLSGVDGCDSIEVSALTILPAPQAAIAPDSVPICHTGATTLTATGGTTYSWSPGNYQTDTITVNPQVKTVYTVLVGDTSVCTSTASVMVYPPGDSAIGITQNKAIFCADDSAELCAPAGYTSYQWSAGVTGTGDCVYVKQAGDYYVEVTDTNGCSIASNHLAVAVYPVPSVSIVVQGDTLASFGQVSYQWILNNEPVQGATGMVYIAKQPGMYSVEVTDTNGCTTISNPVTVTGISGMPDDAWFVNIYPNPSSVGSWQLAVSNGLIGSALEVYDEQGRLVFNSELKTQNSELNLNISSGVYYLHIFSPNVSIIRKLVRL